MVYNDDHLWGDAVDEVADDLGGVEIVDDDQSGEKKKVEDQERGFRGREEEVKRRKDRRRRRSAKSCFVVCLFDHPRTE